MHRCTLLSPRGVVLCDVACSFASHPTAAQQVHDGMVVVGDAAGCVSLLRLDVHGHMRSGLVGRVVVPNMSGAVLGLTYLADWVVHEEGGNDVQEVPQAQHGVFGWVDGAV